MCSIVFNANIIAHDTLNCLKQFEDIKHSAYNNICLKLQNFHVNTV